MKALHVSAGYWPLRGGSELYLQGISERLVRAGHEVIVVTTDAGCAEYFWSPGQAHNELASEVHGGVSIRRCRVRHLPLTPYSFYLLRRAMTWCAALPFDVTGLLDSLGRYVPWVPDFDETVVSVSGLFDVVHGTNISFESPLLSALDFAERRRVPFILTPFVHTGEQSDAYVRRRYTMPHQIRLMQRSDVVIVQTEVERDLIVRCGVPEQKTRKVGVGIDVGRLSGGDGDRFRKAHGLDGPIVTFLGTVTYDKGGVHLVEAMRRLWARGSEAALVIAGSVAARFRCYYDGLPEEVRAKARLLGIISEEEKRDLLAATTLLAMPSRMDSWGIVFLEAWVYGKPVIGAWAGGVPEVISDGDDGFLVPFGDVEALAERLATLLSDEATAQRMGANGQRKVMALYTWDVIFDRIWQIYESVL